MIRNVSVPVGITTPGQPNIAATQWRTMSDQKNMVYYFESAFSPYLFWVELKNLNFVAGSPVRKLSLTENSALLVDGKFVDLQDTIQSFKEIVDGKHDELPEQAFYMVGGIDEALEKAEALKAEGDA